MRRGDRFVPTGRPATRWTEDLRAAGDGARPAAIAANYTDPSVYFLGGGVVKSTPAFRDWFMGKVREHTVLRDEQTRLASFAVVPDLDMAGVRGRRSGCSDHASETVRRPCSPIAAAHPIRWSAVGKPANFGGSEPSLTECRR
jgi:hypothetical protein